MLGHHVGCVASLNAKTYDRPRWYRHNCSLNGGQASQHRFDFLRSAGVVRADVLRVWGLSLINAMGL